MTYPENKKFAFTIIDDTDNAFIEDVQPVYDFLAKMGFRTTKTVWALPPNDNFGGLSLTDYKYRQFVKKLERAGFEIAFHSAGSGRVTRQDTIDGLELFKKFIDNYPKIQINHAQNPDSIYWGVKRFSILKPFWWLSRFRGEDQNSAFFWGDYHKKYFKFTRNLTFPALNTIKVDPVMPYLDLKKQRYSNYWFSASEGGTLKQFNRLTDPRNIEKLKKENGACIIYTHFADGFARKGVLDRNFQRQMAYLSREEGWFVPAGELLEHLLQNGRGKEITSGEELKLDLKWVWGKILKLILRR